MHLTSTHTHPGINAQSDHGAYLSSAQYVSALHAHEQSRWRRRVIIDWSDVELAKTERSKPVEVQKLIAWVRSYPERKDIHVYLCNAMKSGGIRKLQNTLQALGCTVTTTCYRQVAVG